MTRKPTDVVSPNLRIRELLRRRLEKAAEIHHVSLNKEMTMRLEDSFEKDAKMSIEFSASFLKGLVERLDAREYEREKLAGLILVVEPLLEQIDAGNYVATAKAAAKVRQEIERIDRMAALEQRTAPAA